MAYPESILHTFGRAMASGQWRSRAVEAFQNAQRLSLARKEQEEASQYRQQYEGPAALQNAQSNQVRAGASDLSARTRAADFLDTASGAKTARDAIGGQARRAPLDQVPNILGTVNQDPQSPASIEVFKNAQRAAERAKVRTAAGVASVQEKERLKRQSTVDTFQRLNERSIGPRKVAGLPNEEFDRRRDRLEASAARAAYMRSVLQNAAGNITAEELETAMREYDARFGTRPE